MASATIGSDGMRRDASRWMDEAVVSLPGRGMAVGPSQPTPPRRCPIAAEKSLRYPIIQSVQSRSHQN